MPPYKNELNDEFIKQVGGGEDCDRIVWQEETEGRLSNYICPNCGKKYMAMKKRTDGYCLNCEPKLSGIPIPAGDIQSTIPTPSDDKKINKNTLTYEKGIHNRLQKFHHRMARKIH